MANTNCLENMRCPNADCGSEGPFRLVASCWAVVYDSGVDETQSFEWEDDAPCTCCECGHRGVVSDFKTEPEQA